MIREGLTQRPLKIGSVTTLMKKTITFFKKMEIKKMNDLVINIL